MTGDGEPSTPRADNVEFSSGDDSDEEGPRRANLPRMLLHRGPGGRLPEVEIGRTVPIVFTRGMAHSVGMQPKARSG